MLQWSGLFIKDFKLTRTVFFIGLVMNYLLYLTAIHGEGRGRFIAYVRTLSDWRCYSCDLRSNYCIYQFEV